MTKYQIIHADVIEWAKNYKGPLFSFLLSDPPYFLDTIADRFGKVNEQSEGIVADRLKNRSDAASRLASGFLEQDWDTDIAFDPETWKLFRSLMLPGALGMAYSHSRTYHHMTVAIEKAGFIIYPMICWIYSEGFPHPTKLDDPQFDDYRYNRGVLKGSLEPICVFQAPYNGTMKKNIEKYGTGLWNIEAGRIQGHQTKINKLETWSGFGQKKKPDYQSVENAKGAWPNNLICTDNYDLPFDRFFYQAKPKKAELYAGLDVEKKHATAKPVDLNRYLATLVGSPQSFAPRRAFVPFAGSGSEMLGVILSQQYEEVVGVELKEKHIDIAQQRLKFWSGWAEKGYSDPKEIIKLQKKIDKQDKSNSEQISIF